MKMLKLTKDSIESYNQENVIRNNSYPVFYEELDINEEMKPPEDHSPLTVIITHRKLTNDEKIYLHEKYGHGFKFPTIFEDIHNNLQMEVGNRPLTIIEIKN